MNIFSDAKPNDPHGFKEELKIKYVFGKFPNGTGLMLELLKAEVPPLDWAVYCRLLVAEQLIWEEKGDASTKAMLLLMNSKNDNAKKDLRLLYSQGNKSAYAVSAEAMSTQDSNKAPNNPRN